MSKNIWGADPEKYERLSVPFESPEQAQAASDNFMNALAKLREQYKIPDLTVSFQCDVQTKKGVCTVYGGGGWGDQMNQAKLAKQSAEREFKNLLGIIDAILEAFPSAVELMITGEEEIEKRSNDGTNKD